MIYGSYRYIYPPRPKNAIPESDLEFWDDGSLIAQPKLNGSNTTIFTNGEVYHIMNRHNQQISNFRIPIDEISNIYKCSGKGKWIVINGEYMNKSKMDEGGHIFNHKFVIFDILVQDSNHLVGKNFEDRIILLNELYGTKDCEKDYLYGISENIYRVKSFSNNFQNLFNRWKPIDMIEGLVMKRRKSKLELGNTENNNIKSQIKCRKATKNFKY
jgi:ATP-dependent DNA ligase